MSERGKRAAGPRPKILQVLPSIDIGGAERMVLTLLEELNQNVFDHEVCVLGGGPFTDALRQRQTPFRQIAHYNGKKDFRFLWRLARVIRDSKPDLVHAHIFLASYYAGLCGRAMGVPVVSTFHSNYHLESLYERFSLRVIRWCCRKVVMVSRFQMKHFGLSNDCAESTVIHNGVCVPEEAETRAISQREVKKRQLKLTPRERVITYVANLRPVKCHALLLESFRIMCQADPEIRLLLVGDGPLRQTLEQQCEALGIRSKVLFLGAREDVLDLLAITDVAVSSSSSEALSLAIMEAMAMGRPVVAAEVGGNGELIDHGTNGILVPHGDPRAFSEAVLAILKNERRALEFGANARSKARECFSAQNMAVGYRKLYQDAVRKDLKHIRVSEAYS